MGAWGEERFTQLDSGTAEAQPVSPEVLFSCSISDSFPFDLSWIYFNMASATIYFSFYKPLLHTTTMLLLQIVITLSLLYPRHYSKYLP